jgi:hypothetical protein
MGGRMATGTGWLKAGAIEVGGLKVVGRSVDKSVGRADGD